MAEASSFAKSLKIPFQWMATLLIVFFIAVIVFGPMNADYGPRHNPAMMTTRQIGVVMFEYANDHNGVYPTGKSSTEVFQKLIDAGYVTDPTLFWEGFLPVPAKSKANSKILRPENVCYDVTVPVSADSNDALPVVFLTGYRIDYVPRGTATPLFSWAKDWTGLPVYYHGNNTAFLKNDGQPDGVVTNFISQAFDPAGAKFQQLTPDGPLGP
jgi:hypothetical protein